MLDDGVTPDEVVSALERVLNSEPFGASARSRSFLAYVVTETLAGRGQRLSERTVGRRALDRPDDFDGRFDASVRVRATRVRRALDAYYEATPDPIRILLPAGGYIPEFERATTGAGPQVETAVVVTFDADDPGSEALSQEMVDQLDAFPGLRVMGPVKATADESRSVARRLQVRFVLHVTATAGPDTTDVELLVFDATAAALVWTLREPLPMLCESGLDVGDWALRIAGQIGDYNGVILARAGELQTFGEDQWQAMQAYYVIFNSGDRHDVTLAAQALQDVVDRGHTSPMILAAWAHCLAVRAGYGISEDPDADLNRAKEVARAALAADPASATAHLALATAALVSGQPEVAIDEASQAMQLAPFHPSIVGTAGTLMAHAGDWQDGLAGIRQALHLNPNLPGFSRVLLVVDHLFAGDDALALAEATLITTPTEVWGPYFRALALMGLGYTERAHVEMDEALAIDPHILESVDRVVPAYIQMSSTQRELLAARLLMFE